MTEPAGTTSEPVEGTAASLVGPGSLLGACLGTAAMLLPVLYGGSTAFLLGVPVVGVVLMLLPGARVRRLGTGLLASGLVWPLLLAALLVLAATG